MSRKKFHKAAAESLLGDYEPAAPPKRRASYGSTTVNHRKRRSTSQDATTMCVPVRIKGKQKQCKQSYDSSGTKSNATKDDLHLQTLRRCVVHRRGRKQLLGNMAQSRCPRRIDNLAMNL